MADRGNCPGCADKAAPINGGGNRLMAFKPLGEHGPTVYRDMTGIEPEAVERLSRSPFADGGSPFDSEQLFTQAAEPQRTDRDANSASAGGAVVDERVLADIHQLTRSVEMLRRQLARQQTSTYLQEGLPWLEPQATAAPEGGRQADETTHRSDDPNELRRILERIRDRTEGIKVGPSAGERPEPKGEDLFPVPNLGEKEREVWEDALAKTEVQPFTEAEVPRSLKQRFLTVDGQGTLMLLFSDYQFYELDELLTWAEELETVRTRLIDRGVEARIMSENWIVGTVFGIMLGDGPYIVWSAFLAIFLVLLVDFRSLKHALVVMAPLALGIVCIAGGMSLFDIKLNFTNGVVIPCMVGIGIDNAIHIYHRYLEEGPGSAPIVLRHSASATMLASFTTMMGFGAMIIAHHRGIRSVAELALLGITTTYFCTSVVFPLAIQTYEEFARGPRRAAK